MLPSPITSALSTLQAHTVPCLLIGGQACVLYGGAEFSRDLDLVIATQSDALPPLRAALADLRAELIAVPPLRLDLLERGHAVHFRCQRADVAHLRIDVLARPPRIADLGGLWARRVMVPIPEGASVPVIGLPDLVATKKTQRDKDWATVGQLVDADMVRYQQAATPDHVSFWLHEARDADQLLLLAATLPEPAATAVATRPLIAKAIEGDREALELELAQEQIRGKAADRAYWAPLRAELEALRRQARGGEAG